MPAPEILPFPDLDGATIRLRQWRPSDTATVVEASTDDLIPEITTVAANSTQADALAFIEPWNEGSRRTAVRSGFVDEGLLSAWETYDDGRPRDMHAYARVRG